MKRKIRMLFFVTLSLLFFVGFGKKTVELLSDKKLIDLNAAINLCLPGANSAEKEDGQNTEANQTPAPTATPTGAPSNPAGGGETEKEITISIRDDIITYASAMRIQPEKLEDKIRMDHREYVIFRLVDDFAEAHAYRKVLTILEKLEEEISVRYTAD